MSASDRTILSCSNCGYAWYEWNNDLQYVCGFTVFSGTGLDFDDCYEIDVIVETGVMGVGKWPQQLGELANDAFVEHHAWEIELEAMHRPLVLTIEEEGALRFNPLTILRAS